MENETSNVFVIEKKIDFVIKVWSSRAREGERNDWESHLSLQLSYFLRAKNAI